MRRFCVKLMATAWVPLLACPAVLIVASHLAAETNQTSPPPAEPKQAPTTQKYARPPKWPKDVVDTFFPDATAKLVGKRPDYGKPTAVADAGQTPTDGGSSTAADGNWSKLIDAETIETEIKRLAQDMNKTVTAPAQFKGGGYKDCRRQFSVLATLFAITAEYDGDIRWKDAAPQLRNEFARAGRNCKVGTDQTFQEAKQRKQDLADLVGGTRPKSSSDAEAKADWSQVADRPPLMQRLDIAEQNRLTKWLASKQEFTAHRDDVKHEAQLIAAIADIITRPASNLPMMIRISVTPEHSSKAKPKSLPPSTSTIMTKPAKLSATRPNHAPSCHEGYRQ